MQIRFASVGNAARSIALGMGGLLVACSGEIGDTSAPETSAAELRRNAEGAAGSPSDVTGNGAPSGSHYQVNIIGVPRNKTADMTNNGRRIFVALDGRTRINLSEGDFQVLDANGTDGTAAFQLPSPDAENDGVTEYSVYARALGKPGGTSTTTTCATDVATGDEYCSIYSMVAVREGGRSTFTNVSRELLYAYVDLDGDGTAERYPLFDDAMQDYFWQYDNAGLKVLQLRFYPVATNVN